MALPLLIAGTTIGAGLSVFGKLQENEKTRREIDIAEKQYYNKKIINERQFFLGKKQIQAQMLSQTLTTEDQLRDIALQQFHDKSNANANAGMTGMGEGTVYSNIKLLSDVLRMKANAAESIGIANLNATQINAELNKLNYDSGVLELESYMDKINNAKQELSWNEGLFSYAMTAASGALSGAAISNNVEGMLIKNGIDIDKTFENITKSIGDTVSGTFNYISDIPNKIFNEKTLNYISDISNNIYIAKAFDNTKAPNYDIALPISFQQNNMFEPISLPMFNNTKIVNNGGFFNSPLSFGGF